MGGLNPDGARSCPRCKRRHDGRHNVCTSCQYKGRSPEYKATKRARDKRIRGELVTAAVQAYGGRCVCCEETEPIFLTLDHVGDNGAEHRRELGSKDNLWRWLRDHNYPPGFEVLCWNCNCGRARNGGICPHKMEVRV